MGERSSTGCLSRIPGAATFPHRRGHLHLLRTLPEWLKWGSGAPKQVRELRSPAGGTGTAAALVRLVWISSGFFCSWSFPSPSPAGTARLPPERSSSNLKCFVKLCQALGEREGGPRGTEMFRFFIFKTTFSISNDFLSCGC